MIEGKPLSRNGQLLPPKRWTSLARICQVWPGTLRERSPVRKPFWNEIASAGSKVGERHWSTQRTVWASLSSQLKKMIPGYQVIFKENPQRHFWMIAVFCFSSVLLVFRDSRLRHLSCSCKESCLLSGARLGEESLFFLQWRVLKLWILQEDFHFA